MLFTITIALIVLSLVFHEAAHWFEMSRRGIPVVEAGLGFPIGRWLQIRFRWKRFSGTTFTLNPLLIGAYVKPSDRGQKMIEALPYKEYATIFGVGPLANLLFWLMIFFVRPVIDSQISLANPQNQFMMFCVFSIMAFVVYARGALSAYVVPVLGLAAIVLIVMTLAKFGQKGVSGPVGIVEAAKKSSSDGLISALSFAGLMSLNLALLNALPFFPLDGGKIVDKIIGRFGARVQNIFRVVTTAVIFALILGAILGDCSKR